MGYDKNGRCPMLFKGKCSIYEYRPQTCRTYDCRIFAAAGIQAGDKDKTIINERVSRWKFSYPTKLDMNEHLAVQRAADFIQNNARYFPGGRVPENSSQLAIVAIKSYGVFLDIDVNSNNYEGNPSSVSTATAVVEACRKFDENDKPL